MTDLTQDAELMAAIDAIDTAPPLPEEQAFEKMLDIDRPGYLFRANVWLGEDPDTPDLMIGLQADVRLSGGRWYADVFGLPLRCVQVFNVVAATNEPFTLPQAWAAQVVPDDGGPEHEAIITAWDGTGWVGRAGPIDGMIDNPTPTSPEVG